MQNAVNAHQELAQIRLSPIKKFDLKIDSQRLEANHRKQAEFKLNQQSMEREHTGTANVLTYGKQQPASARQIQSLEVSNFDVKAAAAGVGSMRNRILNSSRNFFQHDQNQMVMKSTPNLKIFTSENIVEEMENPNRYSIIEDQLNLENYVSQTYMSAREEPSSQKSQMRPNFFVEPPNDHKDSLLSKQSGIVASKHVITQTNQGPIAQFS